MILVFVYNGEFKGKGFSTTVSAMSLKMTSTGQN